MGDVIRTLPALTDAQKAFADIKFDWVVEEAFSEIPAWHSSVNRIIPIAWRRWRKKPLTLFFHQEWRQFHQLLHQRKYDYIIDAQGLLKSAIVTRMAEGLRCGYDRKSARESLAALAYTKKFAINKAQHMIVRMRQLFAAILCYSFDRETVDYGIKSSANAHPVVNLPKKYCTFVVNTSEKRRRWAIENWRQLLAKMQAAQQQVVIPCGYRQEESYVRSIAADFNNVTLLSETTLQQLRDIIAQSQAVISVETGLAHLAAALGKPTITLYRSTDITHIATMGKQQVHLLSNTQHLDIAVTDVWRQIKLWTP